jgi:hypothetical protein
MARFTLWSTDKGELPANIPLVNNYTATTNPGPSNDSSQGYSTGSVWFNQTLQTIYSCINATKGAANWTEVAANGTPIADTSAAYNVSASAVTFTATGAQITGGSAFVELDLTGNPAGAANVQLPTVAQLLTAIVGPAPGDTYVLRVKNTANSAAWTVTTNTGWTVNGTAAIQTATWRDFIVTINTLTTCTLQNLGAGTL